MYCPCCYKNWKKDVYVSLSILLNDIKYYHCVECSSLTPNPLHGRDLMADKPDPKPKLTVWQSEAVVCQCCQFHSNKPSLCQKHDMLISRKNKGCENFERRK